MFGQVGDIIKEVSDIVLKGDYSEHKAQKLNYLIESGADIQAFYRNNDFVRFLTQHHLHTHIV